MIIVDILIPACHWEEGNENEKLLPRVKILQTAE
jgi:hypothetical protein